MAARRPALRDPGNPFSVSNSAFGAFSLSGGQDPARKALEDASEFRYHVELRYNNGQATNEEYLAAIATEMAAARVLAGSSDADTAQTGRRRVAELENRIFDINDRTAEANARAGGDESLLAYYQGRIGSMAPGTPAYLSMQAAITNLTESIANEREVDASRKASYDIAAARAAYENGTIGDDEWLAALGAYAGAQKPGSAQEIEAKQTVIQWQHSIGRNRIISAIEQNQADWEDLLAFDRDALGKLKPGSEAYRDALAAYQNTQEHILAEWEQNATGTGVLDKYQAGTATAAATLAWYKTLLAGPTFDDNPGMQETIEARIRTFTVNEQDEKDNFTIQKYNDGELRPEDFIAYTRARAADFTPGSPDYNKWSGYYNDARNVLADNKAEDRYRISQEITDLQIFIGKNADPLKGGTSTTRRMLMNDDGSFRYEDITSATAPSASEQEAYRQRQAEVANARRQLAGKQTDVAAAGGFMSADERLTYLQQRQKSVVKNSPQWFDYQSKIDGIRDRINYEQFLSTNEGIKIGYPSVTSAGVAAAGGGKTGGGAAKGGSSATTATGATSAAGDARAVNGKYSYNGRKFTGDDNSATGASLHSGIDFSAPKGTPIYALADGTVTFAGNGGAGAGGAHAIGGGNTINIADAGGTYQYAHQDHFAPGIKVGSKVKKGQLIGFVGNTGPYVSGDHLHLSRFENGVAVDPLTANTGIGSLNSIMSTLQGAGTATASTGGVSSTFDPVQRAKENTGGANVTIDSFMAAYRRQVSGNRYGESNSKTKQFGAYMFTEQEWQNYANKYLGDPPTGEKWTLDHKTQDKIARALFLDVYKQTGTWEAVGHWALTGGPVTRNNMDPTQWKSQDKFNVTALIQNAGGTAPKVPVTSISTPKGTGAPGLLAMDVGAIDKNGVRAAKEVPFDFPHNMEAGAFSDLYDAVERATLQGESVLNYTDSNGTTIAIALPDTPEEHRRILEDLGRRDLNIAILADSDKSASNNGASSGANTRAAQQRAGNNQLAALEFHYGGYLPARGVTTTTIKGTQVSTANERKGLPTTVTALPPGPTKGSSNVPAKRVGGAEGSSALQGDIRATGWVKDPRTGNIVGAATTPNPIAAGLALTEYTEAYIRHEAQLADEAMRFGNLDIAFAHHKNITDAMDAHGQAIPQINGYIKIADAQIKQIEKDHPGFKIADAPEWLMTDVSNLNEAVDRLNTAAEPANKIVLDNQQFLQLDSKGRLQHHDDGSIMMTPGAVMYLVEDEKVPSGIGFKLGKQEITGAWDERDDGKTIDAFAPGMDGQPVKGKAPWKIGTVGILVIPSANGGPPQEIKIKGRVVTLGSGSFENPFTPGRFTPSGIVWNANETVRIEAGVNNATGEPDITQQAIAWTDPATKVEYRLSTNADTGEAVIYKLDRQDSVRGAPGKVIATPLYGADFQKALSVAGIKVDVGRTGREAVSFLIAPDMSYATPGKGPTIAGPWLGYSAAEVAKFVYGPTARKVSEDILNIATGLLRDPKGTASDMYRTATGLIRQAREGSAKADLQYDDMASGLGIPGYSRPQQWQPAAKRTEPWGPGHDPNLAPGAIRFDVFSMDTLLTPEQQALGAAGAAASHGALNLRGINIVPPLLAPYESIRRPQQVVHQGDVIAAGASRPVLQPVRPTPAITPKPRTVVPQAAKRPSADVIGTSYKPPAPSKATVSRGVGASTARASASVTIKPIAKPPVRAPESKQTKPAPKPKPVPKPVYSKANALPGTRF